MKGFAAVRAAFAIPLSWNRKPHPTCHVVLGVFTDQDGQSYYAARQDLFIDTAAFDRFWEYAPGYSGVRAMPAWCRYPADPATGSFQLTFTPHRRAFPVWCSPISS